MTGNAYEYHVPPELDTDSIYQYGVLHIEENDRRGPFRLWFQHDIEQPGNYYLQASSSLGRISYVNPDISCCQKYIWNVNSLVKNQGMFL